MKKLLSGFLLFLTVSTFGQTSDQATATYAKNGKLIGLTNLSGLGECGIKNLQGKVKSVKTAGGTTRFDLRIKKERETVGFNLDRISSTDRERLFRDLVKKGSLLRISGYMCTSDGVIEAISIDRFY